MIIRKALPVYLRGGFETADDKKFAEIVLLSFMVHIILYLSFNFVRVNEDISVAKLPRRIVRLIYESPKSSIREQKQGVKIFADGSMSHGEQLLERRRQEDVTRPSAPERRVVREKAVKTIRERRGTIGKRVRRYGVLKVLTGRSSTRTSRTAVDVLSGIIGRNEDLNDILNDVTGLKKGSTTGWPFEEIGENSLSGGGGRKRGHRKGDRATVPDLLGDTVEPEVGKLEKQGSIQVTVPEEIVGPADKSTARSYEAIKKFVLAAIKGIEHCYKVALRRWPELRGKIVVRFTIDEEGHVLSPQIISTTINCPFLEQEVLKRIRRWQFPATTGGSVTVRYPFIFCPEL
jgi:TonB family protein